MKRRSFRIYLILTLFWTAGIFLHSAMPAAASNAESGGVLAVVQMILPWITHGVLRKAAPPDRAAARRGSAPQRQN